MPAEAPPRARDELQVALQGACLQPGVDPRLFERDQPFGPFRHLGVVFRRIQLGRCQRGSSRLGRGGEGRKRLARRGGRRLCVRDARRPLFGGRLQAHEVLAGRSDLPAKVLDAVAPACPVELRVVGGRAAFADRFQARLEVSREDRGLLLGCGSETLMFGKLRELVRLGRAGRFQLSRRLLGTHGAGRARPHVRERGLGLAQPQRGLRGLGSLWLEVFEAIAERAPAHIDGDSWVGPRPQQAWLSIDAVQRDVFTNHHLSEQPPGDLLVAGLAADMLEKGS